MSATPKSLGTYAAWRAYSYDEGGQKVCYMVTTKILGGAAAKGRATPYLMISHRPTEASSDVFSYGAGMLLDARRGAKIQLGSAAFDLFSVRDTAWSRDALTDHKLAAALQKAPTARLTAYPSRKGAKKISDVFDVKGASGAYQAIGRACGLVKAAPKKR